MQMPACVVGEQLGQAALAVGAVLNPAAVRPTDAMAVACGASSLDVILYWLNAVHLRHGNPRRG